jgi:N-acetyl-gamma-glutamyl-phosphate/LysW-gamma-L-alpha-aminoadipyl-6-phosphate reductase
MSANSRKSITAGIIGGAGYGGTELIKILLFHPEVNLSFVTSRKYAGKRVDEINRFLGGLTDLEFIEPEIEKLAPAPDIIFLATPHGTSMDLVPRLMEKMPAAGIIDLSGDFRLEDPGTYMRYYGKDHTSPELMGDFVYGLSELNRESIAKARYIANPGCFATGMIFALYPLISCGAVSNEVSVVSVTGSSGSGEKPKDVTHHPVRAKNFKSYKILEHQHLPEVEKFFQGKFPGRNLELGFVPQSGPFVRGIFTTVTVYNTDIEEKTIRDAFYSQYENERFVRVVEPSPETTAVYASNYVEVSFVYKRNFIVAMSAIDNLVRGASGQAVQNMNIMFGFNEDAGIQYPGMRP